jgi:phosphoglycerol transferase MdoB-like AlkP superfamily enzyme
MALAACVVLSVVREGFVVWQWPRVQAVHGLPEVFLRGLQMDLQLIAYLVAVPLILFVIAGAKSVKPIGIWLTGWLTFLVFMELATPSFLKEYGVRPNRLFIEYLIYPRELIGLLWGHYKWPIFIAIIVLPLTAVSVWRLYGSLARDLQDWRFTKRLLVFPLLAVAVVAGARSSLGHRPANAATAAFSRDPLVNDLALNSTYSLLYAAYRMKDEAAAGDVYGSMAEAEIVRRVRQAMDAPLEAFDNPSIPTLHHQQAGRTLSRPYNLVIILQPEQAPAQYTYRNRQLKDRRSPDPELAAEALAHAL